MARSSGSTAILRPVLPHGTYQGEDAQLKAVIEQLQEQIRLQPVVVPEAPPHPNKAFKWLLLGLCSCFQVDGPGRFAIFSL